jgi:DNA repair protein RecO (recombination protein O)
VAIVRSEGIVLKTYALGDTSRIVVVYTRDFGLTKLVAKGARKAPHRFGFALEPLSRSRFVFYQKTDRDLHLMSQAEVLAATGSRLSDLARLAHAQAALELVDRLVWGEEPHPDLYDLLAQTIEHAVDAPAASLPAVTIAFELQVASLLGYQPRLDACAGCGRPISQQRLFSASRGGMLCEACARIDAGTVRLSADALAGLSLLLSRPVVDAGEYLEVQRAGEIQRVVEAFLRHHFQRFQGLRSLETLRHLGRPETPDGAARVADAPRAAGAAPERDA